MEDELGKKINWKRGVACKEDYFQCTCTLENNTLAHVAHNDSGEHFP